MRYLIVLSLLSLAFVVQQDRYLEVYKSANLYTEPSSKSSVIEKLGAGTELDLLDGGKQTNGWYHVVSPKGDEGYVYRTRVKGKIGKASRDVSVSSSQERLRKDFWPSIGNGDLIINRDGYVSSMNREHNVPNWVFNHISHDRIKEGDKLSRSRPKKSGRNVYFRDGNYPQLIQNALASSGYDHGHLAPAGDFKIDSAQYAESFFMTNMAPQHGCMNQKGWCLLESNVREWARDRPGSDFYIVSGSVLSDFRDTLCLARIEIHVPKQFFKVVVETNGGKLVGGIGFIVNNEDVNGSAVEDLVLSIDEVEKATGFDFFPNLTNSQEDLVEGRVGDYVIENLSECRNREGDCNGIYSSRAFPEKRRKLNCD